MFGLPGMRLTAPLFDQLVQFWFCIHDPFNTQVLFKATLRSVFSALNRSVATRAALRARRTHALRPLHA